MLQDARKTDFGAALPAETPEAVTPPSPRPKAPRPRRLWLWLPLLAVLAGAGWWVLGREQAPLTAPPTAAATVGDIEVNVLATGLLKPSQLVAVGAQASGRITSLPVRLGQTVRSGDLIALIDSTRKENDLKTSEASLAAMQAQLVEKRALLANQTRTLDRQRALAARNTISAADLDTAEADVAVTEAQITAIEAEIEAARVAVASAEVDLGYTRITAPMDGTVLAVVAQEGQTVNASQSAPTIVVLGDLATMAIHAEISEADVVRVSPGQEVWFTILGDPGRPHQATLTSIAPAPETIIDDQSLTGSSGGDTTSQAIYYNGIFSVPNPDGQLRTYMTAEVRIVLDRAADVLTIPAAALGATDADGRREVTVLGPDNSVEQRWVEVGLDNRDRAEVRSGLRAGETVVLGSGTTLNSDQTASAARRAAGRMPPPMGL